MAAEGVVSKTLGGSKLSIDGYTLPSTNKARGYRGVYAGIEENLMGRLYVDLKPDEKIQIGDSISVELSDISAGKDKIKKARRTRIVVTAPNEIKISRGPVEVDKSWRCRGSYVLGTACGRCYACKEELAKLGAVDAIG